jgi:diguanylate cyclase (GGDEF)-like protein
MRGNADDDDVRNLRPALRPRSRPVPEGSPGGDELERLLATQNAIATAEFDLESVLQTVVDEARQLTSADAAVVALPERDELVYRAVSGSARPYLGMRLRRETGISGLALRTGDVLICHDSETDDRVDHDARRRAGARSMVVVPLLYDGKRTGVLKVTSASPGAFDGRHARILGLLANLIATALVRADLMRKLAALAVTDELTGLPNRRAWYERLDEARARADRSGRPLSVVVLDLDGFKEINDREGHAAGDRILRAVSAGWISVVREVDFLARIGGDEFGLLLEGTDEAASGEIVHRLRRVLPAGLRASAGIATWDGRRSMDALLARADERMYADKRAAESRSARRVR